MGANDDLHHRRTPDTPFAPPSERGPSLAALLVFWISLAVVAAAGMNWWQGQKTAAGNAAASGPVQQQRPQTAPTEPAPAVPAPANPARQAISKCHSSAGTVYTDGACAAGARATVVAIRPNENVIDSVRPIELAQAPGPQVFVAPVSSPEPPSADKAALCAHHEQRIKWIDEEARKPNPPQHLDWLAARRKEHRDAQFRLRC